MSTNDLLARPRPALRTGGESLRRWAGENELRAVAVGGYLLAVLVMLVLVVSPVIGGDGAVPTRSPLAAVAVPDYYTLRKNDTLAGIAERYGLTVDELRALNPGIDPMALAPGTKLRLVESAAPVARTEAQASPKPSREEKKAATAQAAPTTTTPETTSSAAPEAGGTHTVSPGDTLSSIAGRYGTTVSELLALNPGVDPYALVAGQEIAVP
jgi:LysM repeat protein